MKVPVHSAAARAKVADAVAREQAAQEEVNKAQAVLDEKRNSLAEARKAVEEARKEADGELLQGDMVITGRSSEEADGKAAVVRLTPTGQVVVRRVGSEGTEMRFGWNKYQGRIEQQAKGRWDGGRRQLRNLPEAFVKEVVARTKK